jgi:hypothetical protein
LFLPNKNLTLIDAHVHLHSCFDIGTVLDLAWNNFEIVSRQCSDDISFKGVLCLTETSKINNYKKLQQHATERRFFKGLNGNKWHFYFTEENNCLKAICDDGQDIFVIAGCQITTAEHLEVLALATTKMFSDGQSLKHTTHQIIEKGGIPVIPWGVGKWMGKRGKFLTEFILENKDLHFYLGDNSGRPRFWSTISHFELATKGGIKILRGTDPLPFSRDVWRPGSFGFMIYEHLNPFTPASHLKRLLEHDQTDLISYGKLENPGRFFLNQILLKIKKTK